MKIKHIFIVFAIACFFLTGCNSKPTENPGQNEPLEEFSEVIEDTEPDIDPKLYETLNAYEESCGFPIVNFMKAYNASRC